VLAALVALAGAALVVALRSAAPLTERVLTTALGTPVSIGSLVLDLRNGRAEVTDATLGDSDDRLSAKRIDLAVDVRALLDRQIILDDVVVSGLSASVTIDPARKIILAGLPRTSTDKPVSTTVGKPTLLTVRRWAAEDATLTLHHMLQGPARTVKLQIEKVLGKELSVFTNGDDLHLDADVEGTVDDASLKAHLAVTPAGDANAVDVRVEAKQVTLPSKLVDLPQPVSTLKGTVSGTLSYHSHPPKREQWMEVALGIASPRLVGRDDTVVAARSIDVQHLRVDFIGSTVDLGKTRVEQPALTVAATNDGFVLPLQFESSESGAKTTWRLTGGRVDLKGGDVTVRRGEQHYAITIDEGSVDPIATGKRSALDLKGQTPDGGTVTLRGTLGIEPVDLALTVSAEAIGLASVAPMFPPLPLGIAKGTASGSVEVNGPVDALHMSGKLQLDEVHTVPPNAELPGEVLACNKIEADLIIDPQRPGVDVGVLRFSYPYVMVQRSASGVFPYSAFGGNGAASEPSSLAVRIKRIEVGDGRADFLDRTVEPQYWTALAALIAEVAGVEVPGPEVGDFRITALQDEINPVEVTGTADESGWKVRADFRALFLPTLNAYLAPLLGYKAESGVLSLEIDGRVSADRLRTRNVVTLRNASLSQTGLDIIQRGTGVPLPIALALLKDPSGTIELTVPLEGEPRSRSFWLGSLIDQALTKAMVGALQSPLKLLGLLFGTKGPPRALAVDPVAFAPGSDTLDATGMSRLTQIARIMVAHTDLTLVAKPEISPDDVGVVGMDGLEKLADKRAAVVTDALVDGPIEPRLDRDRLVVVPWTPPVDGVLSPRTGVYVEMQLSADYGN